MLSRLHQMNVTYARKEDRLMLRVTTKNGEEYRLWLTRRYTALLLKILQKRMDQYGGAPTLASAQETRKMFKQGATEKKFEAEKSVNLPLGEEGILAFRINSDVTRNGTLALQLLPDKGEGVTLNLSKSLLYMFYNMISQGTAQAEWRLDAGVGAGQKLH